MAVNAYPELPRMEFKLRPSIWDQYDFASITKDHDLDLKSYNGEIDALKGEVKDMLIASARDPVENIVLIDLLCRLGVSYHFENEIEDQLNQIFTAQTIPFDDHQHQYLFKNELEEQLNRVFIAHQSIPFDDHQYDLYTTALLFRVLRQHGYRVSCDLFNKFKDDHGNFKEYLKSDVKGLLSLYEASHLSLHGEVILDEALTFTRTHLTSLIPPLSHNLAEHVSDALTLPYHKATPRVKARKYISFYENQESPNELLLKFAKIDFNRLQILHQKEIVQLLRWGKDTVKIKTKFPYARDRLLECYFFAVGTLFDPGYGRSRLFLAKIIQIVTLHDDTYEVYGKFEELQSYAEAVLRWDDAAIDTLPNYMKFLYKSLKEYCEDFANELEEDRSQALEILKKAWQMLLKAYFTEAKWFKEGYMPPYDEYMKIAKVTGSLHMIMLGCFLGMGAPAKSSIIEWFISIPKLLEAVLINTRLINDLTHEVEHEDEHVISCVESCMEEYGISREEAVEEVFKKSANSWKDINEEWMRPLGVPRKFSLAIVNMNRVSEEIYKHDDGYTNQLSLEDTIASLVVHKIPM
ncbi:casbene synthase chloroplastic-like [Tripterygium wilfordii]|uniref:Casbene synthase chloroplastic-like n=1 Tax=Tripterygium wilfordii TaxID=458696 RepID=A0A7J7DCL2_TRIWF|nr:probable terpene synthase 6 isoform X1 [Tripterygium wilfordii]KAF5743999.1 casbene synthase chloroplastic-like [Tripterygium wilfordii]